MELYPLLKSEVAWIPAVSRELHSGREPRLFAGYMKCL